MDFGALLKEERTIKVNVGPGEVEITYLPQVTSSHYREQLASGKSAEEALAAALTRWGFTENGEPMPVTVDNIKRLSEYAHLAIWKAISEDQLPNRRASVSTESGS